MLTITVPAVELFDEAKSEFIDLPEVTLSLEHSLVSLSRWESKWKKSFLFAKDKTSDEIHGYIQAMCLDENIPAGVFARLTRDNYESINEYINEQMTATTFAEMPNQRASRDIVTAELIYYWMIALQVPVECESWHLNRLMALIKVANLKNQPAKKMGKNQMLAERARLNEERKAKYGSSG